MTFDSGFLEYFLSTYRAGLRFEEAMLRLQRATGISDGEVAALRARVINMAMQSPTSPEEMLGKETHRILKQMNHE